MTTAKQLEQTFSDADWPMDKDGVVAHAERQGADDDVLRTVRSLPLGEYTRMQDVLAGVDTPDTPG